MKKFVKVILVIVIVLVVLMVGAVIIIPKLGLPEEAVSIQVGEVNLSSIEDGTYNGECDAGLVKVKVTVYVENNEVTNISIDKHDNGLGKKAEIIVDDIITAQSLDVDAVSGATISSNAIRKAVEVALKK